MEYYPYSRWNTVYIGLLSTIHVKVITVTVFYILLNENISLTDVYKYTKFNNTVLKENKYTSQFSCINCINKLLRHFVYVIIYSFLLKSYKLH